MIFFGGECRSSNHTFGTSAATTFPNAAAPAFQLTADVCLLFCQSNGSNAEKLTLRRLPHLWTGWIGSQSFQQKW